MRFKILVNIFLRSLFIHAALNYPRMQNLGFCYAMMPLLKRLGMTRDEDAAFIQRHLQLFNTHPYFSGAIIGSVVREELQSEGRGRESVMRIKNTFMAPYAAMGDPLFGGALKPFCSGFCVLLALMGYIFAPVVYLLLFNPLHMWIRIKTFIAGFREGNGAFQYISTLNLTRMTEIIRWLSLVAAGFLAFFLFFKCRMELHTGFAGDMVLSASILVFILVCYFLIKAGISQMVLLYSSTALILLTSWFIC
ncbi:MAG: PTS system mannose/fructose/sorbose family transporter subunit IID [Syntrophaceae bacterium]|nr:PTS system mannose/fructose/sorbose family transporter subunit IID [Syntrophaceae bacterium]